MSDESWNGSVSLCSMICLRQWVTLTVEVADLTQLSRLLDRINQLPSVLEVHRQR